MGPLLFSQNIDSRLLFSASPLLPRALYPSTPRLPKDVDVGVDGATRQQAVALPKAQRPAQRAAVRERAAREAVAASVAAEGSTSQERSSSTRTKTLRATPVLVPIPTLTPTPMPMRTLCKFLRCPGLLLPPRLSPTCPRTSTYLRFRNTSRPRLQRSSVPRPRPRAHPMPNVPAFHLSWMTCRRTVHDRRRT